MTRRIALITAALFAAATACAAAATTGGTREAAATRTPLRIGAVVPELLDPSLQESTVALMERANLGATARVTVTWERGRTAIDPGLLSDLRNGIDLARAAGSDVYLDAYPADSSQTPRTTADQTRFATWLAGVVKGIPGLRHVIVGNEPNLSLFWSPQFGPAGQDVAAVGYERLLARTYDTVKRVRTLMVFRLIDQPALADWQSGVYYADRETPKSSRTAVAASARRFRSGTAAGCAALLAPRPLVDWKRRVLTCDADCAYTETFRRGRASRPVLILSGKGVAAVPTRLAAAKLKPARYRITLRVKATAYKANAFVTASPVLG